MYRLVLLVIALVIYAWAFEWLGFPIATSLVTISIALLFGATPIAAIISGPVLGIFLFYAFDKWLDVTLPIGSLLS